MLYFHFGLLITIILAITINIIHFVKNICNVFAFLSKVSYSLYLTHFLVLIYLLGFTKRIAPAFSSDFLCFSLLDTY